MALNNAHEGYEYQDLLTCYFILKEINNENEATFSVDRKEFKEDIIDDLTISSSSGIFKKQIKYSNETVGHVLAKDDLSNDSNYNLAVYRLFDAWDKNRAKNSTEFRICLAWEPPVDSLLNVLIEVNGHGTFSNYPTKVYKIDADKLWPIDQRPLPSWRKFKEASAKIDRNDFLVFCNRFLIEVALPKFSLNLYNAGDLEKLVLELASRLGIGTYPNQHLSKETFLLALLSMVKRARSKALMVSTKSIFHELKIVTDFGSIAQEFPVIQEENLKRTSTVSKFWEDINKEDKILLVGEPGSGKSWFVENLRRNLVSKKITVVRHLCYIGLDDSLQRERIQLDVFFGNLISELIGAFPHLSSFKQQKFASNLSELNLLLSCIDVPTVIIVDGLDHIERIAKFRNFTDIRSQDIAIIEHLGKLVLSEKVKIIVASQNIEDLKLIANFQRSELPKWRETEIKSFLTKNKVQNVKLEDGSTLSKFLLSKSGGNPLYLKYLLEEIHKLRNFNLAGLENLPDYTFNLSGYYAYLLSQLNTREEVPQILSGVNFSLTKNELQEITHAGDLVEESLQILSPVLVVNISQSGYRIYHESFRRYILEYLESKSISIDKKIFNPIRDWFATKDFFKFRKSFRYFLKFLNEGGLHEEILSLLKYDFVSNSILNGYSWELIEMNYRIFVKSACSRNDFPNVVLLNEIDKVISLCPIHFEELAPVYLDAIGKVNGFEAVVESLLFEGQPAKGLLEGLKACYVCDENGVVAPWESYLDYFQVGKTINLEDFKYYLRGQLVLNNAKRLNNIAKQLVRKKDTGFCEEFRAELFRYGNQDRIAELRAQFRSIDSLLSLQDGVSGSTLTLDLVYGMADELLAVDNVFTRETDLVVRFLNGCRFFAQDPSLEPTIVNKFKARNWFYNWLIYAVKMICLENKKIDYVKVHEAFAYLAYNVEPFEGKPRTCDLYSLHPVIYNSLNNGLKYLNVTSQWEDIIEILVKVSNGTSTTLQRSANGPLTTEKLFRLLAENSCTENRGLINQTFEMLAEEKSEWHLHTDVSEYHLRLASATSHADPVKASAYLVKGISYGLAYTMRKDLTLLDAIDGVAFFHKINPSKAFEDLKKVRILVDSTISHTDGRETDYFPVTWFERFLTMDRKRAMEYLLNELVASRFDFRAEKSLIDLLCSLNGSLSPVTEAFISLTFPICDTEKFVRYQLVLHGKLKTGNPRLAEMLKSRIISEMRPKKDRNRSNETIRLFNDSVEPNERLTITEKKASNPPKPKPFYQTAEDRQMFSDMDMEGLLAFIQLNGIKESYLHPLVYALDSFDGSDKGLRELVSTIVLKNNQNYYDRLDLDLTFQNGGELECQYWICRFMYDRGDWFERFIFQDAFKRAYAIDPQLALSSFFEILPSNLDVGFNSHFSSNLIQLLIDIGYDKATISKMWDNLLQMTSYRLPFQEDIEWDSIYADLDSMDEVELLDCILLSRFKAATTERFRWTSVAIQHLAETNHRGLIKPFQWFLDNKQRFEKSQQVIVLQTIHRVQENKAGFAANFRSILTKEFPTGYFLIDYIIQELYQLPINPISHPKGLIYPKIPQEKYDFIHHINYKFKIYDSVGIDLGHCFNKFSSTLETKYGEYFELYGNSVYRRTISHTYAAEHMLEIMNTDCYEEFLNWSDFDYDGAFKYATFIDIDAIRAELFSFGCRPEDLPKPHELNGNLPITELAIQGENWIRIAHFEKELREEGVFKLKPFKGYGGISFSKSPKNKYPYAPYAVYPFQFWWDRKLNLPIDDEIALLVSKDDPIDHINLVWLNPTLIEAMSLKTEISPEGLIAQNQKSEIVLKMRTWSTDYIGTSMRTVLSDEIPLIRGVDLVIREDYFKKLCGMFSNPPRYMSFHIENYFP